mmetsp:Transcript_46328/g.113675  ORF Transcript_46328/g.113675 Transcript_46328/m.113675 type:complete len:151 (+) Transcript_46328:68-520(+)|eukprot:CAMPEP_0198319822 /NCGR_PEP_ID=MMETSP1450-20131203/8874_1 /TAXON_ID=753684 ORGANISM="Madagascaria erythrocladiodes, Strain CCMP3234" /NCGR_SAMPLE_ID=MMETSP1450 /ASSEMBLY_ACC=CAM_ASM_001115 /LENGTH=150 /DNA_ID=CAMNT_0044023239 /DNA_START=63 /DNA_END=515 /DNA_ORIENTATION=-
MPMLALLGGLAVAAVAVGARAQGLQWKDCCEGDSCLFQVEDVKVSPDPPIIGQELTVSVAGAVTAEVSNGKGNFTVEVRANGVWLPVTSYQVNVCDAVECPVAPSDNYEDSITLQVPEAGNPGLYRGRLSSFTTDGKPIQCLDYITPLQD